MTSRSNRVDWTITLEVGPVYCVLRGVNSRGEIYDEEVFKWQWPMSQAELRDEVREYHGMLYDGLNYSTNGDALELETARGEGEPGIMDAEEHPAMTIFEKLRLLAEWAPMLTYAQQILGEPDIHEKAVIVSDAAEWLASRTEIEWDDELVEKVADILKSPEGEALLRWIVEQVEERPDV